MASRAAGTLPTGTCCPRGGAGHPMHRWERGPQSGSRLLPLWQVPGCHLGHRTCPDGNTGRPASRMALGSIREPEGCRAQHRACPQPVPPEQRVRPWHLGCCEPAGAPPPCGQSPTRARSPPGLPQPGGHGWGWLCLDVLRVGCQVAGMRVRAGQAWSPHECGTSSDGPSGPTGKTDHPGTDQLRP